VEKATKSGAPTYTETVAPGVEITWPMPVQAFLKGNFLERGDVLLTRRKSDLASQMIRYATNSPFSHAAMVFIVPHRETEYSETFVIEAVTNGVDIAKLTSYAMDRNSVIAVRRLERPWFTPELQARVRGYMLESIDARYSYSVVWRIVKRLWFGTRKAISGQTKVVEAFQKKGYRLPNDFICSGFVQVGYAIAIAEAIKQGLAPPSAFNDVIFTPEAAQYLPTNWEDYTKEEIAEIAEIFFDAVDAELQSIVPHHLATAEQLAWRFVIRDGLVYPVSSYEDVRQLIYFRPKFNPQPAAPPAVSATS
jgi:hypothetical protein